MTSGGQDRGACSAPERRCPNVSLAPTTVATAPLSNLFMARQKRVASRWCYQARRVAPPDAWVSRCEASKWTTRSANGELPEGVGRLYVRSSSMMAGYLGREEVERASLKDGWFATGDLAHVDAMGAIHLTGRETEVINVFGMKVVPSEVEAVIALMPGVIEVKVYAGAHGSGSQIVKAAVVTEGPLDTSSIRAHCDGQLAAWKRPEIIVRVESLPRSPSGKVIRERLP